MLESLHFESLRHLSAGFLLSAGLIIAIGAQNAYVLRMGLVRQHVGMIVAVCAVLDALLITAGIAGMGALISNNPSLLTTARVLGAAFLIWYGLRSARQALKPQTMGDSTGDQIKQSRQQALFAVLGFTLLNPHVYLDTVVLVGTIGASRPPAMQVMFGIGAALASITWFVCLGYGARWLTPLFRKPRAWQLLDSAIALVMFGLALSLIKPLVFA